MIERTASGPLLVVYDPDGAERRRIELSGDRVTVGRLSDANDIALEPDPDRLVTRKEHCILRRAGSRWLLVDPGSANGTFIRRDGELSRISSETEIDDGDVVCIVGRWERRKARYWELVYADRTRTREVDVGVGSPGLVYEQGTARLLLRHEGDRHEISLRPQAHKLVLHIARRNAEGRGEPILCSHDELMEAVWGDEQFHTRNDLTRLVWEVRQKLEPYNAYDLVETVRGLGYRVAVTLG
jgi:DNA-binding response OmpR family regulator